MPKPTAKWLAKQREEGPIRLGCRGGCFREDYDGVKLFPSGWADIEEVQTLEQSLTTYEWPEDGEPPRGYSVMDWETHFGVCPECQLAESVRIAEQMKRS